MKHLSALFVAAAIAFGIPAIAAANPAVSAAPEMVQMGSPKQSADMRKDDHRADKHFIHNNVRREAVRQHAASMDQHFNSRHSEMKPDFRRDMNPALRPEMKSEKRDDRRPEMKSEKRDRRAPEKPSFIVIF